MKVGDRFNVAGVSFFLEQGHKAPDDLRCDIWVPERVALSMKVGYFMADFYAQNEQRLYPNIRDAGRRYILGCEGAQLLGWDEAASQLDYEREQARSRREETVETSRRRWYGA